MDRGLLETFTDRAAPSERHFTRLAAVADKRQMVPLAGLNRMTGEVIRLFGVAACEYMKKYGATQEDFAKIAWKNRRHGANNPNASMAGRPPPTLDEV